MILDNCYTSFVNLDYRTDRLKRMLETLNRAGIQAARTRGMLPNEYAGDRAKVKVMQDRTPGAIGCHFSQVKIMQMAHISGQHAFVMEDDLMICQDFHERMKIIDQFCETHPWDIIWLGGTFHVGPPHWYPKTRDAEVTDNPHMMRTYGCFCTYAYLVNKDSIGKVLRMMDEKLHLSMGIDWLMIQLQPELHTYSFVPGLCTQYDNISDIGGRGKAMTVFSNFRKNLGPYVYQEKMSDFDPTTFDWKEAKR